MSACRGTGAETRRSGTRRQALAERTAAPSVQHLREIAEQRQRAQAAHSTAHGAASAVSAVRQNGTEHARSALPRQSGARASDVRVPVLREDVQKCHGAEGKTWACKMLGSARKVLENAIECNWNYIQHVYMDEIVRRSSTMRTKWMNDSHFCILYKLDAVFCEIQLIFYPILLLHRTTWPPTPAKSHTNAHSARKSSPGARICTRTRRKPIRSNITRSAKKITELAHLRSGWVFWRKKKSCF